MYEDKKEKQAPEIIRFLINKLQKNERIFSSLELKMSNPILINSGDRILRFLSEYGMVKYELLSQREGLYKLKSDLFDLINELNRIEDTGEVYVQKIPETLQLELI